MKENALKNELGKELNWRMVREEYKELVNFMKPRYGRLWAGLVILVFNTGVMSLPGQQKLISRIPAYHFVYILMVLACIFCAAMPFHVYQNHKDHMVELAQEGKLKEMNEAFWNAVPWNDNVRLGEKYLIISNIGKLIAYDKIFSVGLRHSSSWRANGLLSIGYVMDGVQCTDDIPLNGINDEDLVCQARELAGMLQEKNPIIKKELDVYFRDAAAEVQNAADSECPPYRA